MRNSLVQKVITDKNGVTTSRWVKPDSGDQTPTRQLPPITPLAPAPVPLGLVPRTTLLTGLYSAFSEHSDPDTEVTPVLKNLDTETLRIISGHLIRENGEADPNLTFFASEWVAAHCDDEAYLRELFVYYDAFEEDTCGTFREDAVMKLHSCAEIPSMDDYSSADDETKARIFELIASAERVYDTEPDAPEQNIILGERMRKMMSDNPDQLDRIVQIMSERNTEDPDLIASIINHEAPSISSGIL